jgi:hypothetical protein
MLRYNFFITGFFLDTPANKLINAFVNDDHLLMVVLFNLIDVPLSKSERATANFAKSL